MQVTVTLDKSLVQWVHSLKNVTPEQAILNVLHEHAVLPALDQQVEDALLLFKQCLLRFPTGIEFEVPQVMGSAIWNSYERTIKLMLGRRIRKQATELGLVFLHKTASNHAVYQRSQVASSQNQA